MESLLALGRYKEAEQAYRDASRLLEGGLGAVSLDQAMARYRQAPRRRAFGAESLVGLELGLSAEDTGAPYYCSYPSFQDIYRIIVRMGERQGAKGLLLLCTLRGEPAGIGPCRGKDPERDPQRASLQTRERDHRRPGQEDTEKDPQRASRQLVVKGCRRYGGQAGAPQRRCSARQPGGTWSGRWPG